MIGAWELTRIDIFEGLPDEELRLLKELGREERYSA